MKELKRAITLVISCVLVVALMFTLGGCKEQQSKQDLSNLMKEFEYSCNTLDMAAMLDCIHPRVSDNVRLLTGLYGVYNGADGSEEILESLSSYLIEGSGEYGGTDFFSSISIEHKDTVIEDDYAYVDTYVSYEIAGDEYKREATFVCEYYTEKWFISEFYLY